LVRVLLLVGLVGFGFYLWDGSKAPKTIASAESVRGFSPMMMPVGAIANTVLILAPENCSSAAAERADRLAAQLSELGIPNRRRSKVSFIVQNPTEAARAAVQRADAVLRGEIPAVFINGMGMANPGVDDVVAAYRSTRGS
jgi:hypothetical protein